MKSILSAMVGATLALSAVEAGAQATPGERQVSLTIESTSLATALDKWAQQSGFQIFVQDWEGAKRLTAPSLKGTFSAQAALDQLLKGTPLTYVWLNDRAVSIRDRKPIVPPTFRTIGDGSERDPRPISRFTDDGQSALHVATNDGPGAQGHESESAPLRPKVDVRSLEEVIVTGSHIRGLENSTVPVKVLDKTYIEATGFSTVAALVESLPQNFSLSSKSGVSVPGVSNSTAQGSTINLRGLGEGTTLILVNGRRLALGFLGSAVDISALPLTAIERVEVLTDGASAVYGSDAVGGVVNFILRDDFQGAETRLRTGWADGGVNEHQVSLALGDTWSSGNALLSAEYYQRDLLPASERSFVPDEALIGSLSPRDKNYSLMFSGRQQIGESLSVFTDALYMNRDSFNRSGSIVDNDTFRVDNPQVTATVGLDWQLGSDWQVETLGSYARNESTQTGERASVTLNKLESRFEIKAASIKADGPAFSIPGGDVHMAVGADWRSESFQSLLSDNAGFIAQTRDADQIVRSLFAEVNVPIVGTANAMAGINRLTLSLAGRLDDYSNFGSSFDPRYGLTWEPIPGLRFRGSYGTSYAAPKLFDYSLSGNAAAALTSTDPDSPTGVSHQLQVFGTDVADLSPQESESTTFGLEFAPASVAGLQLGLNYYRINYGDRIADPPPFAEVILGNPSSFSSLLIRNPSVQQVNDAIAIGQLGQGFFPFNPDFTLDETFDPSTVDVVVDLRRRNLSEIRTSGLDASMIYRLETAEGIVQLGLDGTYIIEMIQRITRTSDPFDTVDTYYNPPDWRARASLGWESHGWAANLFVSHKDSYTDNRDSIPVQVGSYTTVDARVSYDFSERFRSGFMAGMNVSLSAQNLFDRDPPSTALLNPERDMGFDPTNADPMGRFVAVELLKKW